MRRIGVTVLLLGLAMPAGAAGLTKYKDWADSPEAYFLSRAERERWGDVASDAAAEKFIAEYKAARGKGFDAALKNRIDLAEKSYKTGKAKGARSPLGRTLILLGAPASTEKVQAAAKKEKSDVSGSDVLPSGSSGGKGGTGGGEASAAFGNVGGPGPNALRAIEPSEPSVIRWIYSGSSVPPGAGTKEFTIEFEQDAAGNVTFKDPEKAEAVFRKGIEYWAPKPKP